MPSSQLLIPADVTLIMLLPATPSRWQSMANPGTHHVCRSFWRFSGRIEDIYGWGVLAFSCGPNRSIAPPPIEPDVLGDERRITATPCRSRTQASLELPILAGQREVVDRLDAISIRCRFEMAGLDGSAEQDRLASLMEMDDETRPVIPIVLDILVGEALERGKQDVALQDHDVRKGVQQKLPCCRLAGSARAGHHEEREPSDSRAMGASWAGDDRPTRSISADRAIGTESTAPLADVLNHRDLPLRAKRISRR